RVRRRTAALARRRPFVPASSPQPWAAVAILGAGRWGTALRTHLARLAHEGALRARNRTEGKEGACRTALHRASKRDARGPPTAATGAAAPALSVAEWRPQRHERAPRRSRADRCGSSRSGLP